LYFILTVTVYVVVFERLRDTPCVIHLFPVAMETIKRKLVIDVDTGVDDAQAIMLALSSTCVEVKAITCVSGNIGLDQVCRNTLQVITVCDRLDVSTGIC
jgi:hypothetical protein